MKINFKFDNEYNLFLNRYGWSGQIDVDTDRRASVKDWIESFGIPHTEVGKIFVNGEEKGFSTLVTKKSFVDVKAVEIPMNVKKANLLRPNGLEGMRFIADVNVIRLGKLLIMLGFDVVYGNDFSDEKIAGLAEKEGRIVLTRDTRLLMRNAIVFARYIRHDLPYEQLLEVVQSFGLGPDIDFFSRCTVCNKKLEKVLKSDILYLLEPKTKRYFHKFYQCPLCRKVFWKGTHYDHVKARLRQFGLKIR